MAHLFRGHDEQQIIDDALQFARAITILPERFAVLAQGIRCGLKTDLVGLFIAQDCGLHHKESEQVVSDDKKE